MGGWWLLPGHHGKERDTKTSRAIPPDPEHPQPGAGKGITGSIFHSSGRICAPFNRLAYHQHGGPHNNWGGPECWLNVKGQIRETDLAGMFASIVGHLKVSPGMNK